jgi:hemoglobin
MNESRATPYELIGGEDGVHRLVDRFYDLMDSDPEASVIRAMHPPDLETSREKLRLFLTGWLGGPPVYVERFGHPMLRARHLPFAIASAERDQWMACMERALDEQDMPDVLREALRQRFQSMADHMRNRPDVAD